MILLPLEGKNRHFVNLKKQGVVDLVFYDYMNSALSGYLFYDFMNSALSGYLFFFIYFLSIK